MAKPSKMGMMILKKIGDETMDGKTNIQVSRETRDYLAKLGRKGDSYDYIIRKLLAFYEIHKVVGDDIDE